ncbi:methyl-accepting chemotaxis protein [Tepidicella baoligensis]|uniref:methyl-accepting chemotaxis protein n=1 Tax=Tepidicella baoligensis TaxID=2707016 RepID=UPI0015DAF1A2
MRFETRILLSVVVPTVLFIFGLAASMAGLVYTKQQFGGYVETEQRIRSDLSEMYAQGLQMGQALRNVVLNPGDQRAVENLNNARSAYERAYDSVSRVSQGTAFEQPVRGLAALRQTHAQAQEAVLAKVRQQADDTVTTLSGVETPAWRALRAELIQLIEQSGAASDEVYGTVNRNVDRLVMLALAAALVALVVAVASTLYILRTLKRELGGDPADARIAIARIADGDLALALNASSRADSLMGALVRMQQSLRRLVGEVRQSTDNITSASDEIATGSQDLSQRTERTAANLEEAAASVVQLTGLVRQSADVSRQANQLATSAADLAARGGQEVGQVVATMSDIQSRSQKIADIIGVIDSIAFQTNILALNAAVEAARAGEQGRGFAVVASEVRALAGRSAEAAKEIKALIGASVERVETGSSLVVHAGQTMEEIVLSVRRVADLIGEVSAAMSEQSADIGNVNGAVEQLDQMTQQNAALVEESTAAAMSLREQAQHLNQLVSTFKL